MRPSLSKDVTDEIRQSFVIRKTKKLQERKKIISQVMVRRESKRSLESSNHNVGQENKQIKYNPSENRRGYGSTTGYNNNDALIMRRSIHQVIDESSSQPIINWGNNNRTNLRGISTGEGVQANEQIQSDFNACKIECGRLKMERKALKTKLATRDAKTSLLDEQIQSDFYACKTECARLKMKKKALKTKLATRDAKTSLLDQQVSDLTAETKNLKKQLSLWQSKSTRLSELQIKERVKFDNK